MKYSSTRGEAPVLEFSDVLLQGLARDGGLYLPESWPQFDADTIASFAGKPYADVALEVIRPFVGGAIPETDLKAMIDEAYAGFRHPAVTPLVQTGANTFILELFHGPTLAFKDVAMQLLGRMMDYVLTKKGLRATIVGATSGDTGGAAIEAFRGRERTDIFVLYPDGRVSNVQRRQMTTPTEDNVHALALTGNFDDCQAIVKGMFNHFSFRDRVALSGVNSINWARILAQIVYYFYAYTSVVPKGSGKRVSFSVPTGNFGDVLAGYYAKRMGLPVDTLVPATNENDIIHRFFTKGEYFKPSAVSPTLSPSMDICVSSNFERFLFHMADDSAATLAGWMKEFEATGQLKASPELLAKAQGVMTSGRLTQEEILATIKRNFEEHQYLLDPHSAIGVGVAQKLQAELGQGSSPVVCLACAHWGKFTDAVAKAIGQTALDAMPFPPALEAIKTMETRKTVLPATKDAVQHNMKSVLQL